MPIEDRGEDDVESGLVVKKKNDPKAKLNESRSTTYANTKTVAQGFLNISLLSANAGQLRHVILQGPSAQFYYVLMVLIISSMILQIVSSILLALKHFVNFQDDEIDEKEKVKAMLYNNYATVIVMVVTAINVLITAFSG